MEKEILVVNNLNKTFRSGKTELQAVKNVSFSLNQGECLGLIGKAAVAKVQSQILSVVFFPHHLAVFVSQERISK